MTTIRVVVIPEQVRDEDGTCRTVFTAIGLERFIAGQGETSDEACENLEITMRNTVMVNQELGQTALYGISPAPQKLQRMFVEKKATQRAMITIDDTVLSIRPCVVKAAA